MYHCSSCNQSFPDSVGSNCPLCGRVGVQVGDAVFPPPGAAPTPPQQPQMQPPQQPGAQYGQPGGQYGQPGGQYAPPGAQYGQPGGGPYGTPPPGAGYGAQPQSFVAVKSNNTSLGTVSLVSGLLGLFMFFPALLAIITGHMARAKGSGADDSQRSQALVGLILGYLIVAAFFAIIFFFFAAVGWLLDESLDAMASAGV